MRKEQSKFEALLDYNDVAIEEVKRSFIHLKYISKDE